MLTNWWSAGVSNHFQQFYWDLIVGKRPKRALMASIGKRYFTA